MLIKTRYSTLFHSEFNLRCTDITACQCLAFHYILHISSSLLIWSYVEWSKLYYITPQYWCWNIRGLAMKWINNRNLLQNHRKHLEKLQLHQLLDQYWGAVKVSIIENDSCTVHMRMKNFIIIHNSIQFIIPANLWMIFQLDGATRHSDSLLLMNWIVFSQRFCEFNKKNRYQYIIDCFFLKDIFIIVQYYIMQIEDLIMLCNL